MPTPTFAGVHYSFLGLFRAKTKKEGGVKLSRLLKAAGRPGSNPVALAKYVGQLLYSPQFEKLWFRISLWEKDDFRALYPVQVPAALWDGIEEADPEREPSISGAYSPYSMRKKQKLELKASAFRARARK
jgi:hypothetical protein